MEALRAEVLDLIDDAIVELKQVVQPHERATLNELRIEAQDAIDQETLRQITRQVKSLRDFCEKRTKSDTGFSSPLPSGRRRIP
jgi:hypothetical protein